MRATDVVPPLAWAMCAFKRRGGGRTHPTLRSLRLRWRSDASALLVRRAAAAAAEELLAEAVLPAHFAAVGEDSVFGLVRDRRQAMARACGTAQTDDVGVRLTVECGAGCDAATAALIARLTEHPDPHPLTCRGDMSGRLGVPPMSTTGLSSSGSALEW